MDRWHWPSVAAPIPIPSAGGPPTLKNSRSFLFKDAILILPLPQPRTDAICGPLMKPRAADEALHPITQFLFEIPVSSIQRLVVR
jgi:hypothetical protein